MITAGRPAVKEAVIVILGVHDGVTEGVRDAVNVKEGVRVAGWKGVQVIDAVEVFVGVRVTVGVLLAVLVSIPGEGLRVAVPVIVVVGVAVAVGVRMPGAGARAMAMNPMQ